MLSWKRQVNRCRGNSPLRANNYGSYKWYPYKSTPITYIKMYSSQYKCNSHLCKRLLLTNINILLFQTQNNAFF